MRKNISFFWLIWWWRLNGVGRGQRKLLIWFFFFLMHTTWTERGDRKPDFVVVINNDLDFIRLRKSPLPPRLHREVAIFLTLGRLHWICITFGNMLLLLFTGKFLLSQRLKEDAGTRFSGGVTSSLPHHLLPCCCLPHLQRATLC